VLKSFKILKYQIKIIQFQETIELVKAFIQKLSRVGEPSIQIVTAMSQYEHILGGPGLFTSITTSVQALKNLYGLAFAQEMFLQSMEGDVLEHYRGIFKIFEHSSIFFIKNTSTKLFHGLLTQGQNCSKSLGIPTSKQTQKFMATSRNWRKLPKV
jgi:hypothetical protein